MSRQREQAGRGGFNAYRVDGKIVVTKLLYLSPRAKVAHRAFTWAFQRFVSCAAVRTSLQDCHPALDLSFSTVRRQVVFGRPLFLLPSGVHVRAVTQSLSGCYTWINVNLTCLEWNLARIIRSSTGAQSVNAFAACAVLPCAYKVLTFQFPILNCVFGCTIGVLGSRASMWLSLWNVMLCATRPPRFGRLPLMCKVSVIIHFLRG